MLEPSHDVHTTHVTGQSPVHRLEDKVVKKSPFMAVLDKVGEAFKNFGLYLLKPYFILKSEDRVNKLMNYLIRNEPEKMNGLSNRLAKIVQSAAKEKLYSNFDEFILNVNLKILGEPSLVLSAPWLTSAVDQYWISSVNKRNKVQEFFNQIFLKVTRIYRLISVKKLSLQQNYLKSH